MIRAWQGDWHARILGRVRERGFGDVTAFAAAQPCKSFEELADELDRRDVAPIQVQAILYDEALRRGDIVNFAKDCIVRDLRDRIPLGWRIGDNFILNAAGAYASWITALEDAYADHADRAWDWLKAQNIPAGWLPEGPNDPWIEAMFRETGFPGAAEPRKPA